MIVVKKDGVNLIIIPQGDMVSQESTGFLSDVKNLDMKPVENLVVDFSQVSMIDSMGLGALIAIHKILKEGSKVLKVRSIQPDVYKLMVAMGLDRHFSITGI